MNERPGFRSTYDQREWLEDARIAAGAVSLSDWLRGMAIESGEKLLGKPYPRRKLVETERPAKKKSR